MLHTFHYNLIRNHWFLYSLRILNIVIRSWQYNFTQVWISSKQNTIADALPRVTPLIIGDPVIEKEILAVNIVSNSPIKEKEKNILKTAIKYDIE